MAKGKKTCPNCNTVVGAIVKICSNCDFDFSEVAKEKKRIKDQEREEKKIKREEKKMKQEEQKLSKKEGVTVRRGIKICPNCSKEIGVRTITCKCGWDFPSSSIKEVVENEVKKTKTYDTEGPGRKKCPSCDIIISAVTKICPECDFDFVAAKKEKKEMDEEAKSFKEDKKNESNAEKMRPLTAKILSEISGKPFVPSPPKTKRDHAEDTLARGKKHATILYNYAKTHHCWSHVDWDYVGEKLGIAKGEFASEKDIAELVASEQE